MPSYAEVFDDAPAPHPTLPYRPPDSDEPRDRASRVLRCAVTDLVEREHQLRDALHERDLYKELSVVLMGRLHEMTKGAERQRQTVIRLHELVREHVCPSKDRRPA